MENQTPAENVEARYGPEESRWSKALQGLWAAVVVLALGVPGAWAQEAGQTVDQLNTPYSALKPTESSSKMGVQEAGEAGQQPSKATAFTPALSGAEDFIPGGSPATRSFLLPAVNFFQQVDTNPLTSVRPSGPVTLSSILGSLALQRNSGRSQLALNYMGGGTVANRQAVSNGQTGLNSVIQQLEATQTVNWRRWALLMSNQFSYFPESSFGSFQGGPSSFGSGIGGSLGERSPALRSFLTPNQSVLTGRGGRVSNTFLGQGEYHFTARSSITVTGAYGFLRFLDSDLLNGSNAMFMTGYNHQISRTNTLAVIYRFNAVRFSRLGQAIDDHVAQLSYGRRITGRLAFQIAGGPELELFRSGGVASQSSLLWSFESALHYRLRRTALDLSYQRGLTGGAGVLAGAETNQVEVTVTPSLSQRWRGSLGLGYANNQSTASAALSPANRAFTTWYGRVQLGRAVGPSGEEFVAYLVQLQGSDTPFCAGLVCARSLVRHQITVGFNWHHRPIAIR